MLCYRQKQKKNEAAVRRGENNKKGAVNGENEWNGISHYLVVVLSIRYFFALHGFRFICRSTPCLLCSDTFDVVVLWVRQERSEIDVMHASCESATAVAAGGENALSCQLIVRSVRSHGPPLSG